MMIITISKPNWNNNYYVTVESRGHRYWTTYADKPTEKEVKEDFKINKKSFNHIN